MLQLQPSFIHHVGIDFTLHCGAAPPSQAPTGWPSVSRPCGFHVHPYLPAVSAFFPLHRSCVGISEHCSLISHVKVVVSLDLPDAAEPSTNVADAANRSA